MKRILLVGLWLLALAVSNSSSAHEIRPGYLEVRQTEIDTYAITWRVPGRGDGRLMIHALLPANCTATTPIRASRVPGAFIDQWTTTCPDGLVGGTISIGGLATTLTDVLVRIERLDGTLQTTRLTPDSTSMVVVAAPTWQEVAATYLGLGVDHILSGIDHLLFVFALLLLVHGWKRLVATVTAFTVAHSITLAAATLGVVNVSQTPTEAVIALSIAVVAAELLRDNKQATATQRWPWTIAFAFGLLHGFGFAGALTEIGLPEQSIPLALLFFNVGVEIGQLLFIFGCLMLATLARRINLSLPPALAHWPAYGIGSVAAFWTLDRLAGF
jgi:hydrogenase/urease accessory protein HupE